MRDGDGERNQPYGRMLAVDTSSAVTVTGTRRCAEVAHRAPTAATPKHRRLILVDALFVLVHGVRGTNERTRPRLHDHNR